MSVPPTRSPSRSSSTRALGLVAVLAACTSPEFNKESADQQVYDILEQTAADVTGQRKTFPLERPVDTLRNRLLTSREPITLTLTEALDIAAENSREFQAQKETLYSTALALTSEQHNFAVRFDWTASAEVNGTGDDTADASIRNDLSASVNTTAGTRIVVDFVNTFLRSLINGGGFDGTSILGASISQPLLRGAGARIVREPLTQAERDVVYQMRSFEHFRSEFAVNITSQYFSIAAQMANLRSVEANLASVRQSREQTEELYKAGRRTISELGRAKQSEYSAQASQVEALNRLATSLDSFKLQLGLPTTANLQLVEGELDRLRRDGVRAFAADETEVITLALQRRYDHQTTIDEVEDAGRRVLVSEDALRIGLDFTSAIAVPSSGSNEFEMDWSQVNWSAGFQLDLALDKLNERNAYRSSLIQFDRAVRTREQSEDQIAAEVRGALRNIQSALDSYTIQNMALDLARERVEATTDLYAAGRIEALELLDAKDSLLLAELSQTDAVLNYVIARLELMRDLEAVALEPKGLRFDSSLPMPQLKPTE